MEVEIINILNVAREKATIIFNNEVICEQNISVRVDWFKPLHDKWGSEDVFDSGWWDFYIRTEMLIDHIDTKKYIMLKLIFNNFVKDCMGLKIKTVTFYKSFTREEDGHIRFYVISDKDGILGAQHFEYTTLNK